MFAMQKADDYLLAVQEADSMARLIRQDVAILTNFRVVPLINTHERPLEIVRFGEKEEETLWIQ